MRSQDNCVFVDDLHFFLSNPEFRQRLRLPYPKELEDAESQGYVPNDGEMLMVVVKGDWLFDEPKRTFHPIKLRDLNIPDEVYADTTARFVRGKLTLEELDAERLKAGGAK
jgi:hypothetical protein